MSLQTEHKQTRVAENGQLTIPDDLREELGLVPGATVTFVRVGGSLLVVPDNAEFEMAMDRMADFFQSVGVTQEDVTAELTRIRQAEYTRRYSDTAHAGE